MAVGDSFWQGVEGRAEAVGTTDEAANSHESMERV